MESDGSTWRGSAEQRRLREAIYRPGATEADVERFRAAERVALGDGSTAGTAVPEDSVVLSNGGRATRRRSVIAASGVLVGVMVAGLLIWAVAAARHPISAEDGVRPIVSAAASTGAPTSTVRTAQREAMDAGVREFAAGTASPTGPGRFRYVIASGDTMLGIASRFHVCVSDVLAGLPLSMQGDYLRPDTPIELSLAQSSVRPDGTVHCTES